MRLRPRAVVLAMAASAGLVLVPAVPGSSTPVAGASGDDVIALVVEGTGFGHGRGMSQWGAYGWAVDQGKDWQWILDHYYPTTTLGDVDADQTTIRVRLDDYIGDGPVGVVAGSGDVTLSTEASAGEVFAARSLYVEETRPNLFVVHGSDAMACPGASTAEVPGDLLEPGRTQSAAVRRMQVVLNALRVGDDITLTPDGDFGALTETRLADWQADQDLTDDGVWNADDAERARELLDARAFTELGTIVGPLVFTSPDGDDSDVPADDVLGMCGETGEVTHYRGRLEVHNARENTNWVVNQVQTEDYLRGVLPEEIFASWADAADGAGANALRAQAVAARSYGLEQNRYQPYASTCDTQSCQVYSGSATRAWAGADATSIEDDRTDAAIVATAGKVRLRDGAIVSTEFSASNGPRTAGLTFPPVDDVDGDATALNPNHRWTRIVPADAIAADYGLGTLLSATMVDGELDYDGIWWNDVRLVGTEATVDVGAWEFRRQYSDSFGGLLSPGFTVRPVTRDTREMTFAMLGDSVANSTSGSPQSTFSMLTAGTFTVAEIDVRDDRCIARRCIESEELSSGMEAAAALPAGLDLVVVQLGHDQASSAAVDEEIDATMFALASRDVNQVAWVNLPTAPGIAPWSARYATRNDALDAASERWPNLTVYDWDAASTTSEQSRWFGDHARLTTTGRAEFAIWLRDQIATTVIPPRSERSATAFDFDGDGTVDSPDAYAGAGVGDGDVTASGDFDGDGFADLAIGDPSHEIAGVDDAGLVRVVPGGPGGLDPERTRTIRWSGVADGGARTDQRFGAALAVGDFDADGLDDLAIGVPGHEAEAGAVVVVDAAAPRWRSSIWTRVEPGALVIAPSRGFGNQLTAADLDADGFDDLVFGGPDTPLGSFGPMGPKATANLLRGGEDGLIPTVDVVES